jgi:hypothetical protein
MSCYSKYPTNFSREELLHSETALRHNIDNQPHSPEHEKNLLNLAWFLQSLRDALSEHFGKEVPISVSSGYRSEALNTLVGGSKRSAHSHGLAADFRAIGVSVEAVFKFIHEHEAFSHMLDQVIDEFGAWVHVGIRQPKTNKKRWEFLLARKKGGRTVYTPYKA